MIWERKKEKKRIRQIDSMMVCSAEDNGNDTSIIGELFDHCENIDALPHHH